MITMIVISSLCVVIAGLLIYLYFKLKYDKDVFQHESELKDLEILSNSWKKEHEDIIAEYEDYIIKFQTYYDNFTQIIRLSNDRMTEIDVNGSFKADDEVGFFFKNLKEIQDTLNTFDFNKPRIKRDIVNYDLKSDPISTSGKGNIIEISQEQAEKIIANSKK